ncbi:MAG TPA: DUF6152 family protein [Bryobacteraceae bacterium]
MRLRSRLTICTAGAGLLLAVTPLLAHHSFAAEYDSTKRVTLQGKFTKMDWVNPHSWIHMEAMNPATNKIETWDIETGPPNTLYRNGWRKDAIKAGEEITVTGALAKNGSNTVNAQSVKTPDGRTLLAGSSEGNSTGAPPPQTKQ